MIYACAAQHSSRVMQTCISTQVDTLAII